MIRAKFTIVNEQPSTRENGYPDRTTIAEFKIQVDMMEAIATFQQALTNLTHGKAVFDFEPPLRNEA